MILVKRKQLFILVLLFSLIVIFGEIKFFYAINSINAIQNTDLKYEVENFIFAFIVITLLVFTFLVYFIKRSTNLLKRMDKLIELSEYGKYDVHVHLHKLGSFGEKIKYLLYHLTRLNKLKTLRISASSEIISILLDLTDKRTYIFDRAGNIIDYSTRSVSTGDKNKSQIYKMDLSDIFPSLTSEDIFIELQNSRSKISYDNIQVNDDGSTTDHKVEFYPVTNAESQLSNIVAVIF